MRLCCPPGRGCNASRVREPCLLALCREAAAGETCPAIAVERWIALRRACELGCSNRERRFRQRAYERARDRALLALLLHTQAPNEADRDDHGQRSPVRLRDRSVG